MIRPNRISAIYGADGENILDLNAGLAGGLEDKVIGAGSSIMAIKVEPKAHYPSHVLEDGIEFIDHKIRVPLKITASVMLSMRTYIDIFQRIKLAEAKAEPLTVQTKVDVYPNMIIESFPYEESSRFRHAVPVQIFLVERMTPSRDEGSLNDSDVANPADTSTVRRGDSSGTEFSDLSISETIKWGIG
ncbi:hypothetical protein VCHA50P417_20494 [Vibrio chagasii]|nr:hypothetical protein VCHA50P417_20494 [Vibrio chagasii]